MTVRKVALEAGVSTATVSRVINSNGIVNDETRKKILRAIDKIGYEPSTRQRKRSSSASALKYRNIAMLWTAPPDATLSETGQKMILGIIEALKPLGAKLTIDHIDRPDYIPSSVVEGKIDGILLHGPEPSPAVCGWLAKFPAVWLLQSGSIHFGDHVQPDHWFAGELVCKHLIEQGCRHLCCISYTPTPTLPQYWQSRALAFKTCAELHNVPCTVINLPDQATAAMQEKQRVAEEVVARFKQLTPRPDALFVVNDLAGIVHRELLNQGIVPTKDLQMVAGNDDYLNPQTVGIDIADKEIGNLAVDALLWRIKHPKLPQITYALRPQLIIPKVHSTAAR